MLSKIGPAELLIVLLIALLIFGPTKLPKLGKAIGQNIGNFKRSLTAADRADDQSGNHEI